MISKRIFLSDFDINRVKFHMTKYSLVNSAYRDIFCFVKCIDHIQMWLFF